MRKLKLLPVKIFITIILLSAPFASYSWGVLGHRIVGEIASGYLTPKARLAVANILGTESIAIASNWPDFIKSDTSYKYLASWHYVNLPAGLNAENVYAFLISDTTVNAYNRLNFITLQLKSKKLSQVQKIFYLRLLIHIVGDVHQPLHVGRPEDRGGNSIKVTWFNTPYNLHQIWDNVLINFQQLSYTEYARAINHPTPAQFKLWRSQQAWQWFYHSYQLAEQVYGDVKGPDQKLDYEYNFKYIALLEEQLLMGGVHLATVLNDIYK
ncbi:MAG: S1/P1 nuclease [Ferruginibacter sp.]